ncbi:methylosome subunit pICln-like [Pantherophis guttatus]|uniref:Methylosome subunit pICln-like n=1 Tax=Pantherophis guttatus TaxID=94885 RepID=A0A6P9E3V3_PANGU|nr:methylosome subunit pICln-like [Pantherophis guttatus]
MDVRPLAGHSWLSGHQVAAHKFGIPVLRLTCISDFVLGTEIGQGDIPSFYTYEEGLSRLTAEGQATLERLEGMLAQSISTQYHMAGVRTEDTLRDFEDGMEVDAAPVVTGQFEDADVDH